MVAAQITQAGSPLPTRGIAGWLVAVLQSPGTTTKGGLAGGQQTLGRNELRVGNGVQAADLSHDDPGSVALVPPARRFVACGIHSSGSQ